MVMGTLVLIFWIFFSFFFSCKVPRRFWHIFFRLYFLFIPGTPVGPRGVTGLAWLRPWYWYLAFFSLGFKICKTKKKNVFSRQNNEHVLRTNDSYFVFNCFKESSTFAIYLADVNKSNEKVPIYYFLSTFQSELHGHEILLIYLPMLRRSTIGSYTRSVVLSRKNQSISRKKNQLGFFIFFFVKSSFSILTWNEHIKVSSTDIMPPALSNSPQ